LKNPWKKLKDSWNTLLERLAKSNQEEFGRNRMDCCDLHKEDKASGNIKRK
jgi:hypothetical protein